MRKVKSIKKWTICKLNKREVAEYGFEYAVIHPDNAEYLGMGILTPADSDIECETLEQAIAWVQNYNMTEARAMMRETPAEELPEETPAEEPACTLTAMTSADLDELDRATRIAARENLTSAVDELEHVYRITRDATPAETVDAFVAAVGYDDAVAAVATLVNRYSDDARLSHRVVMWAHGIPSAWNTDAALRLGVFTDRIHRAHLDQLAAAMMAYTPEETPAEVVEEPAPEAEKENETMTTEYNYLAAVTADVVEYIREEITEAEDRESLAEHLNDELWTVDGVTGNASGSYTFNRWRAKEYVLADFDAVTEALREFCVESDEIARRFLSEDWEWLDVAARCYVLGQAIEAALDELDGEVYYFADHRDEGDEVTA